MQIKVIEDEETYFSRTQV